MEMPSALVIGLVIGLVIDLVIYRVIYLGRRADLALAC